MNQFILTLTFLNKLQMGLCHTYAEYSDRDTIFDLSAKIKNYLWISNVKLLRSEFMLKV